MVDVSEAWRLAAAHGAEAAARTRTRSTTRARTRTLALRRTEKWPPRSEAATCAADAADACGLICAEHSAPVERSCVQSKAEMTARHELGPSG